METSGTRAELLAERIYELVVRTSTELAPDVRAAFAAGREREDAGTRAALALTTIAENLDMAAELRAPICQDTGMPTFELRYPPSVDPEELRIAIESALERATDEGVLRPNSVNSLTGRNERNAGAGYPVIHLHPWKRDELHVQLMLKGGGSENVSAQYKLPVELPGLGRAGRDLDGVRKCILHAVHQAQGKGCSPGYLGVGIGGDRAGSYELAKQQLFRRMDDTNPEPRLAELESYIMEAANTLGVGTMGFGGEVTVLGCKVGARNRLPACFFVSVAYTCWAFRRQGFHLDPETLEIRSWDYQLEAPPQQAGTTGDTAPAREPRRLQLPLSEEDVRSLKVGDVVLLSGTIHTGRDTFHSYHLEHDAPVDLRGGALYHCGPIMIREGEGWKVRAAGPTTSIREEPYEADIIAKFGLRAIIGKGGMGARTLAALQEHGAVYLNAVGGAAQHIARCVEEVEGVHYLEDFGVPEAMWHLRVRDLPLFVTMDAHGNSLHAEVEHSSFEKLQALAPRVF